MLKLIVVKASILACQSLMNFIFLDRRLANYLYNAWTIVPAIQALSGTFAAPIWPVPVPVLLEADVGLYEFERKWIWLLYARAVADADADIHVYMEG